MSNQLFESLKAYGESDAYPFHMPGHKRNHESGPLSSFYQYDITEIDGFDNLHQPEGLIKEAQERAAALYHSQETFFLINGSTSGLLSAVSAVAGKGKRLIVTRNCHKAVYHAAFLNQLEMEYIYPKILADYDLADGICVSQVEEKIKEIAQKEDIPLQAVHEKIAGIVLTSPTYDGIVSDVAGIVKLAHSCQIPVIIDQAHGAHFGFHPSYPENAVKEGADLVIHSVHKTLPAPTQTALLHFNGTLVDVGKVRKYLRIYQSSSPSYLLMAGIDSCMELLEKEGRQRLTQLLALRAELIRQTRGLKHIHIYPSMAERESAGNPFWESGKEEPGRLVVSVRGTGITGQQFYDILREKYHLQMEMCGADYVVAILSIMDSEEGFCRLAGALKEIDEELDQISLEEQKESYIRTDTPCPQMVLSMSEAFMAKNKEIPLAKAKGQLASDFINLYPPGIPLLVPGERLDREMIALIRQYLEHGYMLQGVEKSENGGEPILKVICQEIVQK